MDGTDTDAIAGAKVSVSVSATELVHVPTRKEKVHDKHYWKGTSASCPVWSDSLVKKTLSKEFLVSFSSSPALKGKGYLS
ncbi:hypothetical protein Tco_1372950, partial [Tanacetum coccineum]